MKPSKMMDEPELERVSDWLAEYGLRVVSEQHYQLLEKARRDLENWKWRTYYLRRGVSNPVIGPPCPDHLLASRPAPSPGRRRSSTSGAPGPAPPRAGGPSTRATPTVPPASRSRRVSCSR